MTLRIVLLTILAASSPAIVQGAESGEALYEQCAACHAIDGGNGTGPTLLGIDGRKAASVEGFRYSRALSRSGITWDAASLDAFIADPQKTVPGTVMPYSGMPDAQQRAALVGYLVTRRP